MRLLSLQVPSSAYLEPRFFVLLFFGCVFIVFLVTKVQASTWLDVLLSGALGSVWFEVAIRIARKRGWL